MSRRRFLAGAGGTAAAFVAMNEVFGRFFNVDPVEMFEPLAAQEASPPRDMFVFDDQLHVVRGTMGDAGHALRAVAQGPTASSPDIPDNPFNQRGMPDERGETWGVWNPELVGLPNSARKLPTRAVHKGHLPGFPGDRGTSEQCHRVGDRRRAQRTGAEKRARGDGR